MGVKKLSRARLFNSEKLGKNVIGDISVGIGMKDAVVSATQHREGYKVTTDIVLDFGTSKNDIKSGGILPNYPSGVSGSTLQTVQICQVTDAVFGVVTQLDAICLEAATDGTTDGTLTDFNIITSSAAQYWGGYLAAGGVPLGTDSQGTTGSLATVGYQQNLYFDNSALTDKYLYLGTGQTTEAAINKGAMSIVVATTGGYGTIREEHTVLAIRDNSAETGAIHYFSASVLTAYNGTAEDSRFNLKGASTAANIAQGIAKGINAHSSFVATPVDGSSATIYVTHANLTRYGDQTNPGWTDADDQTTPITVSNFTGSHPGNLKAGKLLLRFHGFMTPDDI